MARTAWALLDRVIAGLKRPEDIPSGLMAGLAARLEEAIAAPAPDAARTLAQQLTDLVHALMRVSSPDAGRAARGEASAEMNAAYLLGHVGFAQRLASLVAEKRTDRRFLVTMEKPRYRKYVEGLSLRDMTGRELAEYCGEAEETVSRKLKVLRGLGIADFRREGTSFVNFLTPTARAACPPPPAAKPAVVCTAAPRRRAAPTVIQAKAQNLPPALQGLTSFGPSQKPQAEVRA